MEDVSIRRARLGDAPALADCFRRAYQSLRPKPPYLIKPFEGTAEDIAWTIDRHHVWVADHGREVLGGLIVAVRAVDAKILEHGVDPKAAGRGVGRALLDAAEFYCRRAKVSYLKLSANVHMIDSLSYYEALGWKEIGRGLVQIHMIKSLA